MIHKVNVMPLQHPPTFGSAGGELRVKVESVVRTSHCRSERRLQFSPEEFLEKIKILNDIHRLLTV